MVTLLEPELLARLERLQVLTRKRLAGQLASEHRSIRHGETLDFAEYREYHPGDDFRRIDYQAWARLDQLLVRLFEAEDDLTVRLLLDTSASMGGAAASTTGRPVGRGQASIAETAASAARDSEGSSGRRGTAGSGAGVAGGPAKLLQAARVAAALGFVALVRRDVVTLHTFPLDRPAPRFTGRHAAHALFAHLEAVVATGAAGATPFVAAARDLLGRPGPRGVTVVVSDLLTPEWADGLTKLPARGGDLVVVHVLAADELRPSLMGDLDLVDRETGNRVAVSLSAEALRRYEELALAWADGIAQRCRQLGAGYVRLLDDDDVEQALLGRWRAAGILR